MKFETKEELLKPNDEFFDDVDSGFNMGISVAFNSFAERVKFYKKYEGKPIFFGNENVDLYRKFQKWHNNTFACLPNYNDTYEGKLGFELVFNRWLVNYCFGDVI